MKISRMTGRGIETISRLALSDYLHERLLSACAVLGLAAVLAPLLVLFGLKNGIIDTMTERLVRDPRNLEISPVGSGRYGQQWFEYLAGRPETAFVIPQTRSIAANMILRAGSGEKLRTTVVDLIPTGEGDPLLLKWTRVPPGNSDLVLSESAAQRLGITEGQALFGVIGRSVNGVKQQVQVALNVSGILPLEAIQREAAFVRLELLTATENYRDGFGDSEYGWPGPVRPAGDQVYPGFRLYARGINDVATLRGLLTDEGIEVYTRAEEIEIVRSLERSFNLIFALIASVSVAGYFASLASSILANVNRKSRHLGITRLIGFSTASIVSFPIVQSLATSILGTCAAAGLYLTVSAVINHLFGRYLSVGEYVCRLSIGHLLLALVLTVLMGAVASAFAAYRASRIEPSEVIRDV